jgi:hypothetical protein
MDAVYAWNQPDLDLYVPCGDHYFAAKAIRFQKTLMGDRLCGLHKSQNTGCGIGGGVAALAE